MFMFIGQERENRVELNEGGGSGGGDGDSGNGRKSVNEYTKTHI